MSDGVYKPRAGTIPDRVIQHLQQIGAGVMVSSKQIAADLGLSSSNLVTTAMREAVAAGAVIMEKAARAYCYALPGEPEPAPDNDGPLDIQGYHDGDLVFSGATVGEDGRVLLKREQLRQLVTFATTPLVLLAPPGGEA